MRQTTTICSLDAEKLQDFQRDASIVMAISMELAGSDRQRAVFWFRNVSQQELDG
ncbi:hypothetical protein LDO31_18680 [Luteimonas sp. XNQY3]|nr:hypothetical protein [Luteimonas sp. XNQY3]MCD9008219.1 hypothetical protein [Luteimonas sp. XNQY3]